MLSVYFYPFINIAITILLALSIKRDWNYKERQNAVKAIGITLLYFAVLSSPAALNLNIGNYNWIGKAVAVIIIISLIPMLRLSSKHCNIVMCQSGSFNKSIILGIILIIGYALQSYIFGTYPKIITNETILFQATLPGISEELFFRGILLGILNHIFSKQFRVWNIEFGFGLIISSILFGLVHGLMPDQLSVDGFIKTALFGFMLGLIVENSRSVLIPIGLHNLSNVSLSLLNKI